MKKLLAATMKFEVKKASLYPYLLWWHLKEQKKKKNPKKRKEKRKPKNKKGEKKKEKKRNREKRKKRDLEKQKQQNQTQCQPEEHNTLNLWCGVVCGVCRVVFCSGES